VRRSFGDDAVPGRDDAAGAWHWMKDITPSAELRQWFGYDSDRQQQFGAAAPHRHSRHAVPQLVERLAAKYLSVSVMWDRP
jgi:uncharacterized protein YeaO (DUF488 family)